MYRRRVVIPFFALVLATGTLSVTAAATGSPPGNGTAAHPLSAPAVVGWSQPVLADPAQGGSATLTCPTATFCMTVDSHGNALTFDGNTWSAPTQIIPRKRLTRTFPTYSIVSCTSASFCVAVAGGPEFTEDPASYGVVFDGTSWSKFTKIDVGFIDDVSCVTTTFCAAIDVAGRAMTFDGNRWSRPTAVDARGELNAVSCSSPTFCMAVGGTAGTRYAYAYDGSGWSSASGAGTRFAMTDVSCSSIVWCMATNLNRAAIFQNGAWSKPVQVERGSSHFSSLSCKTATWCLAITNRNESVRFDGTGWSLTGRFQVGAYAISTCATVNWCVAVGSNDSGNLVGELHDAVFNGASWSKAELIEEARGQLSSISCPTAAFCEAVDQSGFAVTRDHGRWRAGGQIDTNAGLTGVSCATASFCVAVDSLGYATVFDGSTWSPPAMVDPDGLSSVSCPSPTFCIAVEALDKQGDITIFDGSSWTRPARVLPGYSSISASCTSPTFCIDATAKDDSLFALRYDGTAWSAVDLGMSPSETDRVSCGSPTLCAAVITLQSGGADAETFDGKTWSTPHGLRSSYIPLALSCGTICVAVNAGGYGAIFSGQGWTKHIRIDTGAHVTGISCVHTQACVVVDNSGWAVTRDRSR